MIVGYFQSSLHYHYIYPLTQLHAETNKWPIISLIRVIMILNAFYGIVLSNVFDLSKVYLWTWLNLPKPYKFINACVLLTAHDSIFSMMA